MEKVRNFAVFLNIPLHVYLIWGFGNGNQTGAFYNVIVLLVVFLDFWLSFWQLEIFSAQRDRVSQLWMDFMPYLLEKILLCGAEWAVSYLCSDRELSILSPLFGYVVACAVITAIMLLTAIVTFVTGAARTMLYHKEKR